MERTRTLIDLGAEKVDLEVQESAEGELGADEWNRAAQDIAQLCRTSHKAFGVFRATTTAAPTTATLSAYGSQWGADAGFQPTISKTATGLYTVTFDTTYDDEIGNTETLAFLSAGAVSRVDDSTKIIVPQIYSVTANAFQLAIYELTTGSPVLVDETATGSRPIDIAFWVD